MVSTSLGCYPEAIHAKLVLFRLPADTFSPETILAMMWAVLLTMFTISSPRILGRLGYQAGSKFHVLVRIAPLFAVLTFWLEELLVRVCGAGLPAAQPPGMTFLLPADGVAAPESVTWGDLFCRPGARSRPAGCAAPGYDFSLPADGVAAPESVTWGDLFCRPGARSRLADCAVTGYDCSADLGLSPWLLCVDPATITERSHHLSFIAMCRSWDRG